MSAPEPGRPRGEWVRVSTPATSANLGTGFDAMGVALDLRDVVCAQLLDHGVEVQVEGKGAGEVPLDARHLVVRTLLHALSELGVENVGVRLRCVNRVPHSRGLGSSASAIVAGLALARLLAGLDLDTAWLDDRSARLEGHPDNATAAVHGGAVLAWIPPTPDAPVIVDTLQLVPDLGFVAFVPTRRVATAGARRVLPATVPHRDAVQQAIRAAFLVRAITADPSLLMMATEDRLHQPYRRALMPESLELIDTLRDAGIPAVVSGAGASVLALGTPDQLGNLDHLSPGALDAFEVLRLGVAEGVRVEDASGCAGRVDW